MRLEEMRVVDDVLRSEAVRKKMATSAVLRIERLRVRAAQTTHPRGERRFARVHDEMEVGIHQAIRVAPPPATCDDITKLLHEALSIRDFTKELLVSACQCSDVMDRIG
ncbi:MAG: hypothetical protein ACJ74X_02450 [Gaiellaceae bacterium]